MKKLFLLSLTLGLGVLFNSCGNDDEGTPSAPVLTSFDVDLSTNNTVPAVFGRTETGAAQIDLREDNTLRFSIRIANLSDNDQLTVAHIHAGDPVTAGPVIVGLVDNASITFDGNGFASGEINLTASQLAQIQGQDVYINVHSQNSPAGLVRAQLDRNFALSRNVSLSPFNEIPAVVGRAESGVAFVRIDDENNLFYRVVVDNLEASDMIVAGHIHVGASNENGDVLVNLNITQDNVDESLELVLSTAEALSIRNSSTYVNIHSEQEPGGLLRGQLVE